MEDVIEKIQKNENNIGKIYLTENPNYKIIEFTTSEKGRPIIKKIKIDNYLMNAKHKGILREFEGIQKRDFSDESLYIFEKDKNQIYALVFSYTSRTNQNGTRNKFVLEKVTNTIEEMKTYLENENTYNIPNKLFND